MITVLLGLGFSLTASLYTLMQWQHLRHWIGLLSRTDCGDAPQGQVRISVLVAVRNEATNLPVLLDALLYGQDRVPDEIVIVDDHSTDLSRDLVERRMDSRVRFLPSNGLGKRAALRTGSEAAKGDILLFTDGDCRPESEWVRAMSAPLLDGRAHFVAGPVLVSDRGNNLSRYDALESQGMMVIIASGYAMDVPMLAQGASMGCRRDDLLAVGGFEGLPDRASGDDIFLLERFREGWPSGCHFIPHRGAVVWTEAPPGWLPLLRQRLRWTSKMGSIGSPATRRSMILVFAASLAVLVYLVGLPWWPAGFLWFGAGTVAIKTWGDLLVLRAGWQFSKQYGTPRILPLAIIIHPVLVVFSGLVGPLPFHYQWKGRRVR